MGFDRNPFNSSTTINIQGHPVNFEQAIQRHGQLARLVSARKCPCIKNGAPQMGCPLCGGKGYLFGFQSELEVWNENSRHCIDCPSGALAKIWPNWNPITRVMQVSRFLHPSQGGSFDYPVVSFTDDTITADTTGHPLLNYHQVQCSYAYKVSVPVTGENSFHDGSYVLKALGTEYVYPNGRKTPFSIHGTLINVSRVYNVTQDYTYIVLGFNKRTITLDPEYNTPTLPALPTPQAPPPLPDDVLQVDYEYIKPIKVASGMIEYEYAIQKWGEDIKQGDIEGVIPGTYSVSRGDILTFLVSLLKGQDVIIRGGGAKDELPQFDVYDILEKIEDEDGVIYPQSDFLLMNYNELLWTGGHKPATGKRYSIIYRYHPSYVIYKKPAGVVNAEDKIFPQNVFLRLINKLDMKNIEVTTI